MKQQVQRHRDREKLGVVRKHVDQCPSRSQKVQPRADMPSGVLGACKTNVCLSCHNELGSHALYVTMKLCPLAVVSCAL